MTLGLSAQASQSVIDKIQKSRGAGSSLRIVASVSSFAAFTFYLSLSLITLVKLPQVHSSATVLLSENGIPTHRDPMVLSGALSPDCRLCHPFHQILSSASFSPAWQPCPKPYACHLPGVQSVFRDPLRIFNNNKHLMFPSIPICPLISPSCSLFSLI